MFLRSRIDTLMASSSPSITRYQMIQIILYLSCSFLMPTCADVDAGTDTLLQGQSLRDGEYLTSANTIFRLKFFSPGTSNSKYLGIFYDKPYRTGYSEAVNNPVWDRVGNKEIPVWVGNRDIPVPNLNVHLLIDTTDGQLKISYSGGNTTVSNFTPSAKNTSATILDNGNLVLRQMNPTGSLNRTLWQSFDYPTDTLLPGMKLGINLRTGHKWSLTSWISDQVPASGSFTLGGDQNGSSQLVIWWQGNVYWTNGLWDKGTFSYKDFFGEESNFNYVSNENEKYLTYSQHDNISFTAIRIWSDGTIRKTQKRPEDEFVDTYFDLCSDSGNLSPGCVSKILPKCRKADVLLNVRRVSYYDPGYIYQNQNLSQFDCEAKCRQNCSCIAYNLIYENGTGCQIFNKATVFSNDEKYGEVVYFLNTGGGRGWWVWPVVVLAVLLLPLTVVFVLKDFKGKGDN